MVTVFVMMMIMMMLVMPRAPTLKVPMRNLRTTVAKMEIVMATMATRREYPTM